MAQFSRLANETDTPLENGVAEVVSTRLNVRARTEATELHANRTETMSCQNVCTFVYVFQSSSFTPMNARSAPQTASYVIVRL